MQSFVALAFVGAAAAQAGYGAPPPTYGGANTTSSSSSATVPQYPATTTFACNPAHQYPEGQVCTTISGSLTLVTKTGSSTVPASYPTSSTVCPAAGSTDSQGRYSCNPAHAYPNGQTCKLIDGCYFIEYPATTSSAASKSVPSATSAGKYPTTSASACPAPGTNGPDGRYSCNPAHSYPEGQICDLQDGCYYLRIPGPGVSATPSAPKYTTEVITTDFTTYCPSPTTFTHGPSIYTIKSATTVTLPCKGGCTISKPVYSVPTYAPSKSESKPVYSVPTYAPSKSESKPAPSHPVYYNTTISQPPKYTTEVVTSLTTYCPEPTTFTHGPSTYTVTKATTLTLPCAGGCTVTKSVPAVYTTKVVTESHAVPSKTTVVISQPPVTQTSVYTALTTVCSSTTITHQQSTIVVSSATTLTLPCAGGCTVTKEVPAEPKTTVITASVPAVPTTTLVTKPVEPKTSVVTPPASTYVAPPPSTYVAPPPSTVVTSQPATSAPVYSSRTTTAASATTSGPVVYTGAASHQTAGAIMAVAAAAFFL